MADTQAQPQAPDIGSLVGTGGLAADYSKLYRAKAAQDEVIIGASEKREAVDQARAEKAYKDEGIDLNNLPKPWNAEAEHKKFEADPVQGFGSVGGLFAMIASAFTKAPMENAINGMAGAINGQKEANEAAYQRAYTAWKDNTKLALDRFKTQHDLYEDALGLYSRDVTAGEAQLRNAAVRFGDSHMLMLADHGMVKEMFDLQAARAKAAGDMADLSDKITEHDFKKAALTALQRGFKSTGDPNKDKLILATQALRILSKGAHVGTAEQEAVGQYVMTHNVTDPNFTKGLADIHQKFSTALTDPRKVAYANMLQQWEAENPGKQPTPDVQQELLTKAGLEKASGVNSQTFKVQAIDQILEKHKAAGKPITMAEAEHEYNVTRAAPSGNRLDDLQSKINQTERIISDSDKVLDFLKTYKGGAGILGKIMRGEEIATNIAGISTQSDRVEFRRRVRELQLMVPRILVDAQGRPLKSAQDMVDDVVAGLQAGDTGPNTIRAYEELTAEMKTALQQYRTRQSGGSSGAPDPAVPAGNTNWLNAYPEK